MKSKALFHCKLVNIERDLLFRNLAEKFSFSKNLVFFKKKIRVKKNEENTFFWLFLNFKINK